MLDGATVVATADLTGVRATGTIRHFADGQPQDSDGFAYLALAVYEGAHGCYVFYCDRDWTVVNDMLYASREDAEEQVRLEFRGVQLVDR